MQIRRIIKDYAEQISIGEERCEVPERYTSTVSWSFSFRHSIICFIVGVLFFKYKFLDLKFVILIVLHLTINTEWTVLEAFNQVYLNSTKNFALVRN